MSSNCLTHLTKNASMISGKVTGFVGVMMLSVSMMVSADVPTPSSERFGGLYKITTSSDPIFPATKTNEYFLDFGKGVQAGKTSGSVAVSIRRNPNVSVRVMVWQYFPEQAKILIGTPADDGSRMAVAKGAWIMRGITNGVIFQRGSYQVVLQRADPNDY